MTYAHLKPKRLSKEFNTIVKDDDFSNQWEKMIYALAKEVIKQGYIIQHAEDTYSGGGCHHFFIHTTNGYIFGIHSESIIEEKPLFNDKGKLKRMRVKFFWERSYKTWHTIDHYIDDENHEGFGFEFDQPKYKKRWDFIKITIKAKG